MMWNTLLRHGVLALLVGGFCVLGTAQEGQARSPMSLGLSESAIAPLLKDNVIKVHRCHRRCRFRYARRWGRRVFHRHVGPNCRPVRCGRRFQRRPPGWRRRGCVSIGGGVWVCP